MGFAKKKAWRDRVGKSDKDKAIEWMEGLKERNDFCWMTKGP